MKKALFLLGAVAAMGFVANNSTSDCDCTISMGDIQVPVIEVLEFDGECSEVTADLFPEEWRDIESLGGTFSCVEK